MKKLLRSMLLGTAVGASLLTACDPPPPRKVVAPPVQPEAIPPADTLVDLVRKALADVARDPDPYSRARRLGALLPTLGPEVIPAVKQTLEDELLDLRATEFELLLRFWATHQPEEATRWAKEKAPANFREVAIFSALSVWAEADPRAAASATWDWTADFNDRALEEVVPDALMRGWYAANDPAALRKFLRSHPFGIPGQRAINAYVRAIMRAEGSGPAMRWAESLPDDEEGYKLTVFRRVVDAVSRLDLEAAKVWCERHCDGPNGKNMRWLIGKNWLLVDGPGAFDWLSSTAEGYERDHAVRLVFARWGEMDREGAMSWMAAQTKNGEPAAWLRPTYPVYARLLSGEAPLDAIQWASRIEEENQREAVLIGVARVWRHLDEAAAENWLLQSPLSEEAREKVRNPPKQGPLEPGV